ncbi:MAG: hypothetical protein Q7J84_15945 [Sulfuricaulis sp.]|nr:hypothetical protein [Sulfuricaulis sp.]
MTNSVLSRIEAAGIVAASSRGTEVISNATANTKGSWTQLIASTAFDAQGFILQLNSETSTGNKAFLIDIGIGAAASEQVILANFHEWQYSAFGEHVSLQAYVPLAIPAGSRIAVRQQDSSGSSARNISVQLLAGRLQNYGRAYTYGATTASSNGTAVDPGATANTDGAWAQMTASCDELRGFFICFGVGVSTTKADSRYLVNVGVGGAGSEQVIVPDIALTGIADGTLLLPAVTLFYPMVVTAGSRIALQAQSTDNAAGTRIIHAVLYGFN